MGFEEASAIWVAIHRLQDLSFDTREVLTGHHMLALAEDIKAELDGVYNIVHSTALLLNARPLGSI